MVPSALRFRQSAGAHRCPPGPARAGAPRRKVLAEVVDVNAGLGLGHGFRRRACARRGSAGNPAPRSATGLGSIAIARLPVELSKPAVSQSVCDEARVLGFAVVDFGVQDVDVSACQRGVGRNPFDAAVGVLDAQLGPQSGRRIAVVVGLLEPLERRLVPARGEQGADGVVAAVKLRGYVVGLIFHMLAIVGPAGASTSSPTRLPFRKSS